MKTSKPIRPLFLGRPLLILATVINCTFASLNVSAAELEGFTEPYCTTKVAASETGIIEKLLVREGDRVEEGQPLAVLDNDVHEALLDIAQKHVNAQGRLKAAKAELALNQKRLAKLTKLRKEGHARQEEVDRLDGEASVAKANLLAVQEELQIRVLEHKRVKVQLERRTIRAPVSGVVTKLHKRKGEFVGPNSPDILTLVQLDCLLANFLFTNADARALKRDQIVDIVFHRSGTKAKSRVYYVAPITIAESGTVLVKLRIENKNNKLPCGERCRIQVPAKATLLEPADKADRR